ncbi:MAG: hypothetical protein GY714_21285 [Desulfobacterales bacterium]|nr:hypothetical protein [Desulfobacterales bacterium]
MNKKVENRNGKKRNYSFTIGSILLFCFLLIITSASMFILGVYVGRGNAPVTFKKNDIRAEIASIEDIDKKEVIDNSKTDKIIDKKVTKLEAKKPLRPKKVAEKKVKIPAKKAPEKGIFSIQVGAFKFENDANALVKKLKDEKFPAFKYVNKGSGEIWYRVRVGSFSRREDAKKLLVKLKNKKFDAYLVR